MASWKAWNADRLVQEMLRYLDGNSSKREVMAVDASVARMWRNDMIAAIDRYVSKDDRSLLCAMVATAAQPPNNASDRLKVSIHVDRVLNNLRRERVHKHRDALIVQQKQIARVGQEATLGSRYADEFGEVIKAGQFRKGNNLTAGLERGAHGHFQKADPKE